MLSLTPIFSNTYVPALSACNWHEYQIDRDLERIFSIINVQPTVQHLQPNYSLEENDQQAHFEVELPGVMKENINLDITGSKLAITAKRFRILQTIDKKPVEKPEGANTEANENGKDAEMKNSKDGEQPKPSVIYQLNIRIGQRYDTEKLQASMDGNGILKLVIPWKKKEGPRKIGIA